MQEPYIDLYDDPSFSVGRIGRRRVYTVKGIPYIMFKGNRWELSELVKLSDKDYMLPEGRLNEA